MQRALGGGGGGVVGKKGTSVMQSLDVVNKHKFSVTQAKSHYFVTSSPVFMLCTFLTALQSNYTSEIVLLFVLFPATLLGYRREEYSETMQTRI